MKQQQQRHVCTMLSARTTATKTTTAISAVQLLMLITATTLLFASTSASTATKLPKAATHATPTAAAIVAEAPVIGATSIAAIAAAQGAMSTGRSSGASGSGRADDEIIAARSANLLLQDMKQPGHMVNLTRHHDGDVFRTNGVTNCNADTCVGLSSGTAGLVQMGGSMHDRSSAVGSLAGGGAVGHLDGRLGAKRGKPSAADAGSSCDCRCLPYLSTYREDLGICVDDIHECTLSPFVSGSSSEKIPFVFLPLRGQIIYPSREISFPEIRTPVCAVTGAQYLTTNGWTDLRNPIDTDYPFRMFRDEGRTFLQWLGEPDLRKKMQGRLIVVHLVCRDMMLTLNATAAAAAAAAAKEHFRPPKNVFSPCVAFRVNGSPVKYFHNVSEVLFQSEPTATLASTSDGMSTKEYVVIGVCSLLLGLIYVSSVFLYLHMKKRKNRDQSHLRSSLDDLANEINYPKNDQVTFGAPFNRSGSIYSAASMSNSNEPRSRASISSAVGVHMKEEMGIVKNNPLLQHFPQLSEHHSGFASDISNSNSECETDGGYHDKLKQMQTAVLVHPASAGMTAAMGQSSPGSASRHSSESPVERSSSPTQESECLPEENVSIVEDMMTEEKMEQMRQMVNGTIRKKLFFNPAYFEPHLLAQPPPAAVEFLTKIREVIAIAKYKMATKRYQPSLVVIPEEGAMRSTTPSLYSSQLQMSGTDGCRGCATNRCTGHAKNCGDKRNSIEKWLQTVSQTDGDKAGNSNGSGNGNQQQQQQQQSSADTQRNERRQSPPAHNERQREITPPKQRPPPPPPKPLHNNSSPPRSHVIEIRHNSSAYENTSNIQHNNSAGSNSTTITVNNRNFDAFAALSTAANIYGFAEMGGEIYNNPKFTLHDSPVASQRSHSSSHRSKTSRKRLDVLDQYAAASTPTSLTSADREHYEMLRNMKQLPDMVYDTITRDYTATLPSSNGSYHLDIPTPDYDSTMEKKIKDIYSNSTVLSSVPSVPTPDYSTLSKKSLRQCQPDSPIYRRKSPQYLIVDYETDSLERLNAAKRKSSQSSSSPSSDVSSQLSPSLSTALPLEEELEISHTVYDKVNGFRKDGNVKKKIIAKPENNASKQKEIEARIKYDTPFRGSMTIEVEHEPPSDLELSTDSDQYEPDTLDRKPKKHSFCDVNAWSEHMQKAHNFVNSPADAQNDENASYQSLENMNSLPTLAKQAAKLKQEQAQSQSPLNYMLAHCTRTPSESSVYVKHIVNECSHMRSAEQRHTSFENLRDIYQSKLYRQNSQSSQGSSRSRAQNQEKPNAQAYNDKGRLLTLEAKHSRRQRFMETQVIPPEIETVVVENKTTIKIKTPNLSRTQTTNTAPNSSSQATCESQRGYGTSNSQLASEVQRNYAASPSNPSSSMRSNVLNNSKGFYDLTKNLTGWNTSNTQTPVSSLTTSGRGTPSAKQKLRSPPTPPPPPPPSSTSTTLNSHRSNNSSQQQFRLHPPHAQQQPVAHLYQNQSLHFSTHQTATCTEEETASNHSESTEITRVSDTQANSEFDCSCNNTLDSELHKSEAMERELSIKRDTSETSKSRRNSINKCDDNIEATKNRRNSVNKRETTDTTEHAKSRRNSTSSVNKGDITNESIKSRRNSLSNQLESSKTNLPLSPHANKKLADKHDYGAMYNSQYNGLRNDYSLNKYLNRRKSQDHLDEDPLNINNDAKLESNNNSKNAELDASKLDVISISSRSNRSSSRLSDRTKEMYRNAGVPVGIAYPQRSTANSSTTSTTNVQTVYRCEIEPVQLTHGMQIAMGLKDRAKKAKDLKNAWKKFVSMAASKFSPTTSPAPPFEKKTAATFLESLERDEGISSLIDEHPQVSTPKSSYSAPASQNYYEQRFGTARLQELDSGYMSADSTEVYKRSFYDRYNFRMMSGRDRVIRVDTIADNSDSGSTLTERHKTVNGMPAGELSKNIMLDSNRFEDLEHMGEPPAMDRAHCKQQPDDVSDADSDKTLTRVHDRRRSRSARTGTMNLYSSEDEQGNSPSYGSSETDGETNVEDMWESGAESIETHSVLYKKPFAIQAATGPKKKTI